MNFLDFLKGTGPDAKGRYFRDYILFSPEKWEDCHDHMQWAFPTSTASAYNPNAPLVPKDFTFTDTRNSTTGMTVKEAIRLLLKRYLQSVGIKMYNDLDDRGFSIGIDPDPPFHNPWLAPRNHNLLRMTRVLECLGLFGMKAEQNELYDFLVYEVAYNYPGLITSDTIAFWSAAKDNKLHLLRG